MISRSLILQISQAAKIMQRENNKALRNYNDYFRD